jgi:NAD-dependent histone deacetylase SIR2
MDLVPAPSGETPVKSPVVELEAVDLAEQVNAETIALEEASSDYETDSDDSEGWDLLSDGDSAIQILRDEQLRDGLSMSLNGLTFALPRPSPLSESTWSLG